jgi:chromosome partitioning protein
MPLETRRIAIVNQKGGVGKTTSAVNLGAALVQLGKRVLLIDLDPQANLSLHLGIDVPPQGRDGKGPGPTIYGVLMGSQTLAQVVQLTSTAGLLVAPSNIDLTGAELELASAIGREQILAEAVAVFESESERVDFVLIDCPPSLGLLSLNALVASTEILITLQTEFLALQGTSRLVELVQLLRRRLNPALQITGILPCLYDSRLKLAREVLAEIRAHFPERVFQRAIHTNVKLAEAPSFGQTIFEYAPDSRGAQDYLAVARELLGIGVEEETAIAESGMANVELTPAPKDGASAQDREPPKVPEALDLPPSAEVLGPPVLGHTEGTPAP